MRNKSFYKGLKYILELACHNKGNQLDSERKHKGHTRENSNRLPIPLYGSRLYIFILEKSLEEKTWEHQRAVKEEMKVTENKVGQQKKKQMPQKET